MDEFSAFNRIKNSCFIELCETSDVPMDAGLESVLGSIEVCVGVFCVLMDFVKRRLSSLVWHICRASYGYTVYIRARLRDLSLLKD